ncbi:glycoside hydrolase family 113 [Candidatus Palauibacter sp.]|uniref:glycoside hydrolase family 113 n=1 Tax=Candidatus Palauibacter sp. TaxID=3101350 RepID=UPI003B02C692
MRKTRVVTRGPGFVAAVLALLVSAGCGSIGAGADAAAAGRSAGRSAGLREPSVPDVSVPPEDRIRGVSFSAPRREMASDALQSAAAAGADWVAVIPYAFVDPADPRVAFDRERQFWGETADGVARTIEYARGSGLSVLLKPHLWVRGQGWPGQFEPRTAEQWETFLSDYREYILRFAEVADSMDVEMLSVGTEVDLVALARPEYWRALIADVRAIYGGRLTYAANWDKYARIEFWDALDLVGVDAYFPLADDPTPAVEMLVEAWEPWSDELREVARTTGKPILFAEFGYRSVDGAAGRQWELPEGRRARGLPSNGAAQAAAYEAMFRVWWNRPWFAGGFAWKWYAGTPSAEWIATDYSPQGKAAETVMASWYEGDASAGVRPAVPLPLRVPATAGVPATAAGPITAAALGPGRVPSGGRPER